MKIYLFRHGTTKGNQEHRYVGSTDEGILESEKEALRQKGESLPTLDGLFVSPYCRCRESAQALFSGLFIQNLEAGFGKFRQNENIIIRENLREMDFGAFEYKSYSELNGNPDYQKYIDSGGKTAFPGGEEPEAFRRRCREAFCQCIDTAQEKQWDTIGFVVHGGTIMAVMEKFACPRKSYFDYQVKNGCGYLVRMESHGLDTIKLIIEEEIR